MPLFWRYLLSQYFKTFTLSIFAFIALLLVTQLEEIAHLTGLGADWVILARFISYQIPYILPIAIPIGCLIASLLLFQSLSQSYQLTAFRACQLSLSDLLLPILLTSAILSLVNFYITSEIASNAHLATRKMVYDLTSGNPLLIIQNTKIARLKGTYIQMDPDDHGRQAKNFLLATHHSQTNRLNLIFVKKIDIKDQEMVGKNVTVISSIAPKKEGAFDHLIIENQRECRNQALEFAKIFRRQGIKIANDHLKSGLLLARIKELKKQSSFSLSKIYDHKALSKCYSEIIRRISLGLAPFTFSLLGASFGIEISRKKNKKGTLTVIFLGAFTLATFFVAKELDHLFFIASFLFVIPHLLIVLSSLRSLKRINQGIE